METHSTNRFGIVADDLTGALDGGLQAWNHGQRVRVVLPGYPSEGLLEGITVFDTESRNRGTEAAKARSADVVSQLESSSVRLVYKKIDSTLRGNPGAELDFLLTHLPFKAAFVSPALPHLGRTVRDGFLYVDGIPLIETEFGADPLAPVRSSSVADILSAATDLPIRELTGPELLRTAADPALFFRALQKEAGPVIYVADAVDSEGLRAAARIVDGGRGGILPCGSAGLLEYIPMDFVTTRPPYTDSAAGKPSTRGRVFVVSSSMSVTTRNQIDAFIKDVSAERVSPIRDALFNGGGVDDLAAADADTLSRALVAGKNAVLDAGGSRIDFERHPAAAESDRIQEYVAAVIKMVVDSAGSLLSGIIIAGGETALSVCRSLGAEAIEIAQEAEPFVPVGRLIGGSAEGMAIVTKAGGFGTPSVFSTAAALLDGANEGVR